MSLMMGLNIGLLINGVFGEGYYNEFMCLLCWDDFLCQFVVKGCVVMLLIFGQVEGDIYIFIGSGLNQYCLVCWWVIGVFVLIWEYMLFRLGWWVQVVNEVMFDGQVKMYEFGVSGWIELVGGMVDVLSDGSNYVCNNGVWGKFGIVVGVDFNGMLFFNLMFDSGCYVGSINLLILCFIEVFFSLFLILWNGVLIVDGGKYIYDNIINGGMVGNFNQCV